MVIQAIRRSEIIKHDSGSIIRDLMESVILDIHNEVYEKHGLHPDEYVLSGITPIVEDGPMNKGFCYRYKADVIIIRK